ncbi:MAG: class I mannose-6-phosphate isomerase [Lachnospiraceae bacterium]|nr:class I mannose-6-phosphate isomerase [Lachnospiraceae bacterium]
MSCPEQSILFINPVFKQMLWGGERLGKDWPYEIPGNDTGECWAVSAHPNGDCTIKGGRFDGCKLSALWEKEPGLFGNTGLDRFPLLVKLINAEGYSSIQVHPNDTYAKAHENGSYGKMECWYILDGREDSNLVVGHNAETREELRSMVQNREWKELIREVHVEKDDFIQIEPGTIHTFGGGLMILEIQQNSDITYRVYDFDRLTDGKPRELHLDKALEVISVPSKPLEHYIKKTGNMPENTMNLLIECDYYRVWKMDINKPFTIEQDQPFMLMSVTRGEGTINGTVIKKGDHFILPYGYGDINLEGDMQVIASACNCI